MTCAKARKCHGLQSLPNEVLLHVASFLAPPQVGALKMCCRHLNKLLVHDFDSRAVLKQYTSFYATHPEAPLSLHFINILKKNQRTINFFNLLIQAVGENNYSFVQVLYSHNFIHPKLWEMMFKISCVWGIKPMVRFLLDKQMFVMSEVKYAMFAAMATRNYIVVLYLMLWTPLKSWTPFIMLCVAFILSILDFMLSFGKGKRRKRATVIVIPFETLNNDAHVSELQLE
jgi:hypothetical protein